MNARKILILMAAIALEESGQPELAALVRAASIDDYSAQGPTSSFRLFGGGRSSQYFSKFTPDIVRHFTGNAKVDRLQLVFELPLDVVQAQAIVSVTNASLPTWLVGQKETA